mmetsp:Transcript_35753/g.113694  ORF Transcript_35753/g.113694 Transcript_35753/m.113694 type:complete len:110 (+) Transcript_35753:486-815(+)
MAKVSLQEGFSQTILHCGSGHGSGEQLQAHTGSSQELSQDRLPQSIEQWGLLQTVSHWEHLPCSHCGDSGGCGGHSTTHCGSGQVLLHRELSSFRHVVTHLGGWHTGLQ